MWTILNAGSSYPEWTILHTGSSYPERGEIFHSREKAEEVARGCTDVNNSLTVYELVPVAEFRAVFSVQATVIRK